MAVKNRTIVSLSDREVVKYAIGEIVTFLLLRLLLLAALGAAAWWAWKRVEPWLPKLLA